MPNFQKIFDIFQDVVTKYPMKALLLCALVSAIPCLIHYFSGGDLWANSLNFGFTSFYWGSVPIFLFSSWLVLLPVAIYIKLQYTIAKLDEERVALKRERKNLETFRALKERRASGEIPF